MEVEQSTTVMAKKLWNIVRIMFYMMRKGLSKNKFWVDVHMMLKRGKLAGKAIGNLMLEHQYSSLTCRSNDIHMSFVSPKEYEFSCSNSPVYPSYYTRRKHHHHHHHKYRHADDVHVNVQKVFDILNHYESVQGSPMVLPGFGKSPAVRQLRVTDSPFPLKDNEEADDRADQVDKAAEEFIKNFYKELKQQKKRAALESPSPFHKWGR